MSVKPDEPSEKWAPPAYAKPDAMVRRQVTDAELAAALETAAKLARALQVLPERHRALVWSYLAGEMMENGS